MVAAELRAQRGAHGLTLAGLEERTGIKQAQLSRMQREVTAIDMEQLAAIADAFGMTPEEFLGSARRNAQRRRADAVYRPDGTLDPEVVRGTGESDDHVADIAAQRAGRSAGKRISTPTT